MEEWYSKQFDPDRERKQAVFDCMLPSAVPLLQVSAVHNESGDITHAVNYCMIEGLPVCFKAFMLLTGYSKHQVYDCRFRIMRGHTSLMSLPKMIDSLTPKMTAQDIFINKASLAQLACAEWQQKYADPDGGGHGFNCPLSPTTIIIQKPAAGFQGWHEMYLRRNDWSGVAEESVNMQNFCKVHMFFNPHIKFSKKKGTHATCPECAANEHALQQAKSSDERQDIRQRHLRHIETYRGEANYYVRLCAEAAEDKSLLVIAADYLDSTKTVGIHWKLGSPGNMARDLRNYKSNLCIVRIAGIAVLGFMVPPHLDAKDANVMVEIFRRTLIWLKRNGHLHSGVQRLEFRIDSAADNLNKTFFRFLHFVAAEMGKAVVNASVGLPNHTKNNVDRSGAHVWSVTLSVQMRCPDDHDHAFRVAMSPSDKVRKGGNGLLEKIDQVAVHEVIFVESVPDWTLAFSDDFNCEFAGHRQAEVFIVPGPTGRIDLSSCDKPHLFSFKKQPSGQVTFHYKIFSTDTLSLPLLMLGDAAVRDSVGGVSTDPNGLDWLTPQAKKTTWADVSLNYAKQSLTFHPAAVIKFAEAVVEKDSSFRDMCFTGVILRDRPPLVQQCGEDHFRTDPEDEYNVDGLEPWERNNPRQNAPAGFNKDRTKGYSESVFSKVGMVQAWRLHFEATKIPLNIDGRPVLASSTTDGLPPLRCQLPELDSVGFRGSCPAGMPRPSTRAALITDNAVTPQPITHRSYTRQTKKDDYAQRLAFADSILGFCELCFEPHSMQNPLRVCDGIVQRGNRGARKCVAVDDRDLMKSFQLNDMSDTVFIGCEHNRLRRADTDTTMTAKYNVQSSSRQVTLNTRYKMNGFDAKTGVAHLDNGGILFENVNRRTSTFCRRCSPQWLSRHFHPHADGRSVPYACLPCAQKSVQSKGTLFPMAVVEQAIASNMAFFRLQFFGSYLRVPPRALMNSVDANAALQAAMRCAADMQKNARHQNQWYSVAEMRENGWHKPFLTDWMREKYYSTSQQLQCGDIIDVYNEALCGFSRATVRVDGEHTNLQWRAGGRQEDVVIANLIFRRVLVQAASELVQQQQQPVQAGAPHQGDDDIVLPVEPDLSSVYPEEDVSPTGMEWYEN
jgi:hypothetical protein